MPPATGITTSSAIAAGMLRTWTGMTCPGPRQRRSASGCFGNANSFFVGCVPSALRGALPPVDILFVGKDGEMEKQVTDAANAGAHNGHAAAEAGKCPVAH